MNVVLIGSGNVAWNLGRLLKQSGHTIVQVMGHNAKTATELAYELDTESSTYWSVLKPDADIYLVTVNDDSLPDLGKQLKLHKGWALHTSGTVPIDVLKRSAPKYGVLYPLQSLRYGNRNLPEIPFLIEGNDGRSTAELLSFANTLSPQQVRIVSTEQRRQMHLAAVLVNNFTNYLFTRAEEWCEKNGLEFKQLLSLIKETANRLEHASPKDVQTGPAARNDESTIKLHRKLLEGDAKLLELYDLFTGGIMGV